MVRTNTIVIMGLTLVSSAPGQSPSSVWDGVYSAGQAERGRTLYNEHCAACHGEKLEGDAQTARARKLNRALPPLSGDVFTGNWNGRTLSDLFDKIVKTMPWDEAGKIGRKEKADVVAYLLKFNRFPEGAAEMPSDSEALADIKFYAVKPK
jgi:quinoprotein glucose dehydrogenase